MTDPNNVLDALRAGPVLVERLRSEVPELADVQLIEALNIDQVLAGDVRTPLGYVFFDGEEPVSEARDSRSVLAEQTWRVVLAVRNHQQDHELGQEPGVLLTRMKRALRGYKAPPELGLRSAFVRTSSPKPSYLKNINLYPLAYTVQLMDQ